ncbi:MAG: pilus assembly protein [Novosphingobium sp.]|nr:pilus assembly protein [Novosphingobium sp.]MCP5380490.1 pilus assembly protein [Novosphingobium sp.]MCP5389388.1 pilus assembly protein [Novosphingobium sp.]
MIARGLSSLARRLAHDTAGTSLVEFALVAPTLLLVIMGIFDISYNIYTATQLQGAVQKAARDSTLEDGSVNMAAIDARVTAAVHDLSSTATVSFDRKNYTNFSNVAQPEDWTDSDGNGICDDGEAFEDVNANGTWDADMGSTGLGGARDAVLYRVTIAYDRPFPLANMIGLPTRQQTVASTVLRNQPWTTQSTSPPAIGTCA